MARDRQRAKRRKEKRQPSPPSRQDGNAVVPDPRPLHRENVPGPVEHTGEVDEFEAELAAGAEGEPSDADDAELEREALEADRVAAELAALDDPYATAAADDDGDYGDDVDDEAYDDLEYDEDEDDVYAAARDEEPDPLLARS